MLAGAWKAKSWKAKSENGEERGPGVGDRGRGQKKGEGGWRLVRLGLSTRRTRRWHGVEAEWRSAFKTKLSFRGPLCFSVCSVLKRWVVSIVALIIGQMDACGERR